MTVARFIAPVMAFAVVACQATIAIKDTLKHPKTSALFAIWSPVFAMLLYAVWVIFACGALSASGHDPLVWSESLRLGIMALIMWIAFVMNDTKLGQGTLASIK
jgi:heme exporter protein D